MAAEARASGPYTVEGVKVDVTAESALAARDQAFAKAQTDAFSLLAKNLLPPEQFAGFTAPAPAILAGMIRDYEITQEKLSRTRYSGTYTFRFKEAPVHRYLNIVVAEEPSMSDPAYGTMDYPVAADRRRASLLVLPFYRSGNDMLLWSPDNIWMQAWSENIQGGSSLLTVPIGDLLDVKDIGDNQARTYNRQRLQDMVGRYGAGEAVLAVMLPDMPQPGAFTVNIYRTDRGEPELARRIFVSGTGQSPNMVMNEAVSRTRELLRGTWKDRIHTEAIPVQPEPMPMSESFPEAGGTHYLGSVRFANFQEWAALQRDISRIPGVSRVVIQSLSPREAIIEISYAGDVSVLRRELDYYRVMLVGHETSTPVPLPVHPVIPYNTQFYQPAREPGVQPVPESAPPPVRDPSSYINNF